MLRQLLQALRYAIADFFDVPWPGVAALLAVVSCLVARAYIRTIYGASSHNISQGLLMMGALIGIYAAKNHLKKR